MDPHELKLRTRCAFPQGTRRIPCCPCATALLELSNALASLFQVKLLVEVRVLTLDTVVVTASAQVPPGDISPVVQIPCSFTESGLAGHKTERAK